MGWPFERGRTYNRRRDIHQPFGGQQQGGIITPKAHPLVIIITGEEGEQHGYADRMRDDGAFEYFGEGQVGPMRMWKGNLAIANHSVNGKSLLLFRKQRDGKLRYDGEWVCEAHHTEPAPDREGTLRSALVFELRPLEAVEAASDERFASDLNTRGLAELRQRALAAAAENPRTAVQTRNVFQRSHDVKAYVLARAAGNCEGCDTPAPFLRIDGTPYLEPHHIRRLSDGGPDDPRFVIALCPTCHRRVHLGQGGGDYNTFLLGRMGELEGGSD